MCWLRRRMSRTEPLIHLHKPININRKESVKDKPSSQLELTQSDRYLLTNDSVHPFVAMGATEILLLFPNMNLVVYIQSLKLVC